MIIPELIIKLEHDMYYSIDGVSRDTAYGQWFEPPSVNARDALKGPRNDPDALDEAVKEALL